MRCHLFLFFIMLFAVKLPAQNDVVKANYIIDKPVVDENKVYKLKEVDKQPYFAEGTESYIKRFKKKLWIPNYVRREANVIHLNIKFVIEKDGSISNIRTTATGYHAYPGNSLATETEKALRKLPKWIPGEVGGKAVRVELFMPFTIYIN